MRIKWAAIFFTSITPVISGALCDPIPDSDLSFAVCWAAASLEMAAPVGFATWLTWRFRATSKQWRTLLFYSLFLVPPSLLGSSLAYRVSLFVQTTSIYVFDPRGSYLPGDATFALEIVPDCLRFASLVISLTAIRWLTGVTLIRDSEPVRPPSRVTISSMLILTFVVAVAFFLVNFAMRSNRAILSELNLWHGQFNWWDVYDVVTPFSSGIAAATTLYLLATTSIGPRALVQFPLAFGVLLIPELLENQLLAAVFARESASIFPSVFEIIGAISGLVLYAGCVAILPLCGLRFDFGRGTGAVEPRRRKQLSTAKGVDCNGRLRLGTHRSGR